MTGAGRRFQLTPGFLILLTAVTVVCGLRLTLLTALAAGVHELGHLTAIWLSGGGVGRLRMSASGAELTLDSRHTFLEDALIALAGPVTSAMGAMLCGAALELSPSDALRELAGLNILYCAINLLPASPLDGGRAVYAAVSAVYGPGAAYRTAAALDAVCVTAAIAGSAYILVVTRGNITPLICTIFLLNACCKSAGFRVKSI